MDAQRVMGREQPLNILQVIWAAFLGAVAMYGIVCFVLSRTLPPEPPAAADLLRWPLSLAALSIGGGSILWRQRYVQAVSGAVVPPPSAAGASASPTAGATPLMTACVVAWAMSEAVAIVGLVSGLLARSVTEFFPFGLGALLLLYVHRPAAWPIDTARRPDGGAA